MTLGTDLDSYRATEGTYTIEVEPPSCLHIFDLLRVCRHCGETTVQDEDVEE